MSDGLIKRIGWPRIIISAVLVMLILTAMLTGMDWVSLINDMVRRWGQYGILVLAMVPGIQCGIGLNFGVSLGIVGGLLGGLISMELTGQYGLWMSMTPAGRAWMMLLTALVAGIAISTLIGIGYGFLLNNVKGSEMTVSTYVGFSAIAFMNIMWLILPFKNGEIMLPLGGSGLRQTITLEFSFGSVLNNFLMLKIPLAGKVLTIPTGLLLFFFLVCFIVWLFFRSKPGMTMTAAGSNGAFARANGINVNKTRILGTTISTILGGVGIITYAQSYGFLQLYNAPMMMGFTCVASVLIGGATIRRAGVSNVVAGTLMFQGLLALGLPVANNIIPVSSLSEVSRLIISNGIILYALSKSGGRSRG
ncbi:MAG: ABC transporter permease [Clostridiales bacterium]|nr:ABC transporter permease [Clostridiales bacterium]